MDEQTLKKYGYQPIVSDKQAANLLRREIKHLLKFQQRTGWSPNLSDLLAIKTGNWFKLIDRSAKKDAFRSTVIVQLECSKSPVKKSLKRPVKHKSSVKDWVKNLIAVVFLLAWLLLFFGVPFSLILRLWGWHPFFGCFSLLFFLLIAFGGEHTTRL